MAFVLYTELVSPLDITRARVDAGVAFEKHRFALPFPGESEALEIFERDEDGSASDQNLLSRSLLDSVGPDDLPQPPLRVHLLVDSDLNTGRTSPIWLKQLLDAPDSLYLVVPQGTVEIDTGERRAPADLVSRCLGTSIELRGMGTLLRLDDRGMAFELLARPEFRNSALLADPAPDLVQMHAGGSPRASLFRGFSRGGRIRFADFHQAVSSCSWLMTAHGFKPVVISVYVSEVRHEKLLALLAAHSPSRVRTIYDLPQRPDIELPSPYQVRRLEPEGVPLARAECLVIKARGRLDDLLQCRFLRKLVVDDSIWLDHESIARLGQLRSLSMKGVKLGNFDFLVPLVHLEELCLSRLPFAGVNELGKPTGLRALKVQEVALPSLAFVAKLNRLETLHVERLLEPDRALQALAGHPSLHSVVISESNLANIGFLATMHLRRFETLRSKVSDLGPLAGQHTLKRLCLQESQVRDLIPLSGLQGLQELDLLGCPIRDLTPLASCPALRLLDLEYTWNVDWEGVAQLAHLEVLYLQSSSITNLKPLSALRELRILDLRNTDIRSLEPLAKLAQLEELIISKTPVRDLTPLVRLPQLRRLVIDVEQAESALGTRLRAEIDVEPKNSTSSSIRSQ